MCVSWLCIPLDCGLKFNCALAEQLFIKRSAKAIGSLDQLEANEKSILKLLLGNVWFFGESTLSRF